MANIPGSEAITSIFFFIIPGFITYAVKDSLVKFEKRSDTDKIIEVLVYSFLIYTILSFFNIQIFQINSIEEIVVIQPTPLILGSIWLISGLLGIVIAYISKENWMYRISGKLGFGTMTGRPNVWDELFEPDDKSYVWVKMYKEDGSTIEGNLIYSSDFDDKELYLENVSMTDKEGNETETHYDGMYIHDEDIKYIEISKQEKEN